MLGVLLRIRVQMASHSVRAASARHKIVVGLLGAFGLGLFTLLAALCAGLVLLAQGGVPVADGLSPAAHSLAARLYDYLFFFLLAGSAPFMAGTLFGADDVPLLLATPISLRVVVAAKLLDAIGVNAAQFVALGVPVLAGAGWAVGLNAGGWLWLTVATLLLLTLPPSATALALLVSARWLGMRRVRSAVTLVSIGLGLAITGLAVVGASRAARSGALDIGRVQAALRGAGGLGEEPIPAQKPAPTIRETYPRPSEWGDPSTAQRVLNGKGEDEFPYPAPSPSPPGRGQARSARDGTGVGSSGPGSEGGELTWLPSSWAAAMLESTAGGRSLHGRGVLGLGALTGATALLVALCLAVGPGVITSDAFLEQTSMARRRARRDSFRLPGLSLPVAGLLAKDGKYVARDLVLLGQIGTALILFLVPFLLKMAQGAASGLEDLYGALALAMVGMIVYMVTSIVSLSSVGLEGRGFWMVLASPVSVSAFLRAKWLGAFGLSATVSGVLLLVAWPAFALSAPLTLTALAVSLCACFALSGLGVGLAGLFPRFVYENPAHRASVSALISGFVLATGYVALSGLLAGAAYLLTTLNAVPPTLAWAGAAVLFLLLSGVTGALPLALATRRLRDYEWEA